MEEEKAKGKKEELEEKSEQEEVEDKGEEGSRCGRGAGEEQDRRKNQKKRKNEQKCTRKEGRGRIIDGQRERERKEGGGISRGEEIGRRER